MECGGLLFLLLLLLGLGYAPSPGLTQCSITKKTVTVVGDGEEKVIQEREGSGNRIDSQPLYVFVSSSHLPGVTVTATVEAETDDQKQTLSISHVFTPPDKYVTKKSWMKTKMWVNLRGNKEALLGIRINNCRLECRINLNDGTTTAAAKHTARGLNITARGPSRWTAATPSKGCKTSRRGCKTTHLSTTNRPSEPPSCTQEIVHTLFKITRTITPTTPQTPTTPPKPPTIITLVKSHNASQFAKQFSKEGMAGGVVGGSAAVVAGGVMWWIKKKLTAMGQPAGDTQPFQEPHVNDTTAVTEIELHEASSDEGKGPAGTAEEATTRVMKATTKTTTCRSGTKSDEGGEGGKFSSSFFTPLARRAATLLIQHTTEA